MKLFKQNKLISQLMTKLANEQITSRLLRKEVAQLKDNLENMRIIAERFEEELNTSRKAVAFESELSRRLMEQLEEKGHEVVKFRDLSHHYEDEVIKLRDMKRKGQ